jgi:hypothetical protein
VGISHPSVPTVMFCRKKGSGLAFYTFVRNLAHLEDMELYKESVESRVEVSFDIEWFGIVCWVWMQVDMGFFESGGVFLMSLIGLLSLGRNLKSQIGSDL